jgi:hypothetical protein
MKIGAAQVRCFRVNSIENLIFTLHQFICLRKLGLKKYMYNIEIKSPYRIVLRFNPFMDPVTINFTAIPFFKPLSHTSFSYIYGEHVYKMKI